MGLELNKVYLDDCVKGLAKLDDGSVDLAFADPPFNIGYDYDVYEDKQTSGEYLKWSRKWMDALWPVLKPNGTFWLAIGDEYAAELKLIAQEVGFSCRSWVIWYYTFGVNCKRGFSRSHTHLFHFVKDPEDFTFNADNPAVRVPSARQLVYGDSRANPRGRLPDNTWILRPQDVPDSFSEEEDTWYFARVAGTFKEREGFHGCQMPEQLLGRIIRCCSEPVGVVLDPFGGSGTTFVAAKKLGRRWVGFELSEDYVKRINHRLKNTPVDSLLDGVADPLTSAPATDSPRAKTLSDRKSNAKPAAANKKTPKAKPKTPKAKPKTPKAKPKNPKKARKLKPTALTEDVQNGIIAAFKATHDGCSTDRLLADPDLNGAFVKACKKSGLKGYPTEWNRLLLSIRKRGKLPRINKKVLVLGLQQMDAFSYGSEIAMHQMAIDPGLTLDDVLCDPRLAKMFDKIAGKFAPGHSAFEYRWAALAIRKRAKRAKTLAVEKCEEWLTKRLPRKRKLSDDWSKYSHPGAYIVSSGKDTLYVGETLDLQTRIEALRDCDAWQELGVTSIIPIREDTIPYALQSILIGRTEAMLNASEHLKPKLVY